MCSYLYATMRLFRNKFPLESKEYLIALSSFHEELLAFPIKLKFLLQIINLPFSLLSASE